MNLPTLKGTIHRRILVNFRADPDVVQCKLPSPFRPKLHNGEAIVGICLIRLQQMRPAWCAWPVGVASENAAHRIAVVWDENGCQREGVFIPRRDTGSALNHLTGGRLFPGQHHFASFRVDSAPKGVLPTSVDLQMKSRDGLVEVRVHGQVTQAWPADSCFDSLAQASAFFESGSLGYSVRHDCSRLDGLLLKTKSWRVESLQLSEAYSSYYANEKAFPKSSVTFDHALLMRNVEHEWHAAETIRA